MKALTDLQISEIQKAVAEGKTTKTALAKKYDVSTRTIGRALEVKLDTTEKPKVTEEDHYTFVATQDTVMVTRNDSDTRTLIKSEDTKKLFNKVVKLLESRDMAKAYHEINPIDDMTEIREEGIFRIKTRENIVSYELNGVSYNLNGSIAKRMLKLARKGKSLKSISSFAKKLIKNPTPSAVDSLYDFLLATNIEIASNGNILAYKRVNLDFTDVYTGKYDNSVGKEVSMPRHLVVEDRHQTCAEGLHVCSEAYLKNYSGARVVLVEVNPKDFVSVPFDYYDGDLAKARICKYKVIKDVTNKFNFI